MLISLGTTLENTDVLAAKLGGQHSFLIFQGGNLKQPLVVPYSVLLKAFLASLPPAPTGTAVWGSIGAGTGVGSQADLVAYLAANYYPLSSNPAGYVTASSLATTLLGYVTTAALSAALAGYVPTSRTLTINGVTFDLSADRSWTVSGGSAAWGSIAAGTGVGSQADLVAYLVANYYPLSGNPSGFITSAALAPYLTSSAAASTYVPLTRTITINGVTLDLSANRSWTISGATWGSITGSITSQSDLIAYLVANYYPLVGNPSGFITSAALAPYLTSATAASTYTPLTRTVTGTKSITGGGDLSANRTVELVNDEASPTANKYYGTNSAGTKGFFNLPINAIYPYQLRNYYRAYFPYSMTLYNNSVLHVCYNASASTGGNQSINTSTTDSLNTVTLATGMYNQVVTITGSDEIWATSVGVTTVQRLVASTGALISNTALTGALTSSATTRFIQFSGTKVFFANATNFVACNNAFVTSSLTAHGLGSIPYFAVNNNGSSAQNGTVMLVGTNGLVLVNGTTNAVTVAATTLTGAIGSSCDVIYDSTNDKWIIMTTVGGNPRIVYLTPATATTFTVFEIITEFTSFGTSLNPGNALPGKLLIDTAKNYLFAVTAGAIQQYVLSTGEFIKSLNYRVSATNTVSSAAIDTTNRQLYVNSASSNAVIITQFQYE